MRRTIRSISLASAAFLGLALTACGESQPPAAKAAALPAGLIVHGATDGPGVGTAKPSAKVGQPITLVGCIGGSKDPFVQGRAVFTIVDPTIVSCKAMGDEEHCPTPWDYCCEPRENLRKNIATIEIAGADGRPLPIAVRGMDGLDPLATIAVTGTVTEANDAGLLVVRATRIAVK